VREPEREYRFLLRRPLASALLERAARQLRPVIYDPARPVAYARTTYFDSADGAFARSLALETRRRIRVREYAAAVDLAAPPRFTGLCFLELKESTGTARTKQRRVAEPAELERVLAASGLRPCLTTWYRRLTLADAGERVRFTMDEGITYSRPQALGRAGELVPLTGQIELGATRVFEIKVTGAAPAWLTALLGDLPAPDTQFSKCRTGMRALRSRRSPTERRTLPLDLPPIQEP
jgi:hypothetical protein